MTTERTPGTGQDYADRVLQEAMLGGTCGLDPDRVATGVADTVEAFAKQAAALRAMEYVADREVTCPHCDRRHVVTLPMPPDVVARTQAHGVKAADTVVRLVEFASGRPDSRADKVTDWLRGLTDEQVRIVQGRVEANAAKGGKTDGPRDGRRG
jgi:hypothetical protein